MVYDNWQAFRLDTRGWFSYEFQSRAGMAELVDAVDSKSTGGNALGVRFPLPVPQEYQGFTCNLLGHVKPLSFG
jgi:hypothetical protein